MALPVVSTVNGLTITDLTSTLTGMYKVNVAETALAHFRDGNYRALNFYFKWTAGTETQLDMYFESKTYRKGLGTIDINNTFSLMETLSTGEVTPVKRTFKKATLQADNVMHYIHSDNPRFLFQVPIENSCAELNVYIVITGTISGTIDVNVQDENMCL